MRVLWSRALSIWVGRGVKKKKDRDKSCGNGSRVRKHNRKSFSLRLYPTRTHTYSHHPQSFPRGWGKNAFILIFKQKYIAQTCVRRCPGVEDNKKKCDPCQLGEEKGNCSDTMAKPEKENNYSRVNETAS